MSQPKKAPMIGMDQAVESDHVTSEALPDFQEITEAVFFSPDDPRSPTYVRVLKRSKPRWAMILLWMLLPLPVLAGAGLLLDYAGLPILGSIAVCFGLLVLWLVLTAKQAVLCAVRLYQYFAPDRIRNRCRYEPSCSEYMIRAVEKYGVVRGVKRGIGRLRRCNVRGGGYDLP